ncbi:MAG: hypothetical protein KKD74_13600 [Bacteroidetes bacterium]|nr:hypothetical protein [Bacteroidota bacterium]
MRFCLMCLLLLVFMLPQGTVNAQEKETLATAEKKPHSPHRATLYSMMLPGLGQVYNHKYWKVPVIYAGIGVIGYVGITNRNNYLKAKEAYIYVSNGDDYPIDNDLVGKYPAEDLIVIRDYYRRNMELSWIVMGLWYALNVIDATVDAHLFDYDVGENLSVHLEPVLNLPMQRSAFGPAPAAAGLQINVRF